MTLQLREVDGGVILAVRAQPGAKRDRVVSAYDGGLKIAIAAPPVDGKANAALTAFLAELFGLRRSQVELLKGATGAAKQFLLKGTNVADVTRRVREIIGS